MGRVWARMWEPPEDYRLVIQLFLRGIAIVYAIAFASMGVQVLGLSGSQGILPLVELQANLDAHLGLRKYLAAPMVFWVSSADWVLQLVPWVGFVLAVMAALGLLNRSAFILCYILYLSLYHAGSLFMNFQWDTLVLEAGFLAIFLVNGGSRLVVWLMRWLLFRLRFLSGISKLLSGDPAWSGLSAVVVYFHVQPLPHAGAWYAHQLPATLLMAAAAVVLIIEILVPFLFIAPRTPRMIGAWLTIGLQLLIMATSNHNFINLLTILLCLFLFDDQAVRRVVPKALADHLDQPRALMGRFEKRLLAVFAVLILSTSAVQVHAMATDTKPRGLAHALEQHVSRFALSNRYHVFPTMKAERQELILHWSRDGRTWTPLDFRYKPGNPAEAPKWVQPHHPRLDWMLWFVPLGHPEFQMVYQRFAGRLVQGSPPVLDLLPGSVAEDFKTNGPPRYIVPTLVTYTFSTPRVREQTGYWWMMGETQPFPPRR